MPKSMYLLGFVQNATATSSQLSSDLESRVLSEGNQLTSLRQFWTWLFTLEILLQALIPISQVLRLILTFSPFFILSFIPVLSLWVLFLPNSLSKPPNSLPMPNQFKPFNCPKLIIQTGKLSLKFTNFYPHQNKTVKKKISFP